MPVQPDLSWPTALRDFLQSYGAPSVPVEQLQGLSHNYVWRVVGTSTSFVVKAAPLPKELLFYQAIAPRLNAQDIATPQLLWADTSSQTAWFVLEDIPIPLPRTRWQADPDVLTLLKRLHNATLDSVPLPLFVPAWTDALTHTALTLLPISHRSSTKQILHTLQMQSQHLFRTQCWISGDPNPLNWGIRQDGTVVLYDWERFGRGTPALDLAITVPGLGNWPAFEQVARQYVDAQPSAYTDGITIATLTREIAYAKVWNVVEFLAMVSAGEVEQTEGVLALVQQLPEWLDTIIR